MPSLETERLIIRPFSMDDLEAIYRILDVELAEAAAEEDEQNVLEARRKWLQWTVLNEEQLARLYQPPLGDRAVLLKQSGRLIGVVGYVPCLDFYSQLPYFRARSEKPAGRFTTTELGLFYAVSPAYQRQGYATEAARAMVRYAFQELKLARVIATTSQDNLPSIAVMRRLGMHIERNPEPEPAWLQVVGILENG